jgi:hypothetical protein
MKTQTLSSILYHRWAEIEQNHQSYTSIPHHRLAEMELIYENSIIL